jgi:hypothetical protein
MTDSPYSGPKRPRSFAPGDKPRFGGGSREGGYSPRPPRDGDGFRPRPPRDGDGGGGGGASIAKTVASNLVSIAKTAVSSHAAATRAASGRAAMMKAAFDRAVVTKAVTNRARLATPRAAIVSGHASSATIAPVVIAHSGRVRHARKVVSAAATSVVRRAIAIPLASANVSSAAPSAAAILRRAKTVLSAATATGSNRAASIATALVKVVVTSAATARHAVHAATSMPIAHHACANSTIGHALSRCQKAMRPTSTASMHA